MGWRHGEGDGGVIGEAKYGEEVVEMRGRGRGTRGGMRVVGRMRELMQHVTAAVETS
ncbi:hypothetical protein WMY93_023500 [Mugilogobius chulae]|uniref:G-patch domain-containing protein n=1 Tax=Mugilogobius chulae TaxID=88201 RepID=A0AAW0N8W9_9GOBI